MLENKNFVLELKVKLIGSHLIKLLHLLGIFYIISLIEKFTLTQNIFDKFSLNLIL